MHTGMLWFDNSPAALETKIQKAVEYYQKKFGRRPDLCLVHPSMLMDSAESKKPALDRAQEITVRAYRPVLPDHLWIGVEDNL